MLEFRILVVPYTTAPGHCRERAADQRYYGTRSVRWIGFRQYRVHHGDNLRPR